MSPEALRDALNARRLTAWAAADMRPMRPNPAARFWGVRGARVEREVAAGVGVFVGQCSAKHPLRVDAQLGMVGGQDAALVRGVAVPVRDGHVRTLCPECGELSQLRALVATYNPDKVCSARCMNARGPSCDCSCGGANHSASHRMER